MPVSRPGVSMYHDFPSQFSACLLKYLRNLSGVLYNIGTFGNLLPEINCLYVINQRPINDLCRPILDLVLDRT